MRGSWKICEEAFDVHESSLNFVAEAGTAGAQARRVSWKLRRGGSQSRAGAHPVKRPRDVAGAGRVSGVACRGGGLKALTESGGWRIPIVVESGQVLDTHHVALLIAAGASGVLPVSRVGAGFSLRPDGVARFRFAVEKGLRKVIARMGVSTIASYRNSQLFEVIGLDPDLCAEIFESAGCVPGGKTLDGLLDDCLATTRLLSPPMSRRLQDAGLYRFRQNGEQHAQRAEIVVRRMHRYIKSPTDENFKAFDELAGERKEPRSATCSRFATRQRSRFRTSRPKPRC